MTASAHIDTFTRDNLPARGVQPTFTFTLPELQYPARINCVAELLDHWVVQGEGQRPCIVSPAETLSYAQLQERVNRIANVLTRDLGMVPGNRVLLRAPNNPMMAAAWLAVVKAGGVAVATMPLLRAKEISYPIIKAKIALVLCDSCLSDEMEKAQTQSPSLQRVVYWSGNTNGELEKLMAKPGYEKFI